MLDPTTVPDTIPLACGHHIPATEGIRVWNYYDSRWATTEAVDQWVCEPDTSGLFKTGFTYWFTYIDQSRAICEGCAVRRGHVP